MSRQQDMAEVSTAGGRRSWKNIPVLEGAALGCRVLRHSAREDAQSRRLRRSRRHLSDGNSSIMVTLTTLAEISAQVEENMLGSSILLKALQQVDGPSSGNCLIWWQFLQREFNYLDSAE